jgi:hypothetical protein
MEGEIYLAPTGAPHAVPLIGFFLFVRGAERDEIILFATSAFRANQLPRGEMEETCLALTAHVLLRFRNQLSQISFWHMTLPF